MSLFQKRVILGIAIALAISAAAFAIYVGVTREPIAASSDVTLHDYKYLVGIYHGYVAVFVAGEPAPAYITDAPISTLPLADREMLAAGIKIHTEEELSAILEDYST